MIQRDDTFCIFEPGEVKELALHATDLYFQNMSQELRDSLMKDPIKYTTLYANIYIETIREIESNRLFKETKIRR